MVQFCILILSIPLPFFISCLSLKEVMHANNIQSIQAIKHMIQPASPIPSMYLPFILGKLHLFYTKFHSSHNSASKVIGFTHSSHQLPNFIQCPTQIQILAKIGQKI